MPSNDKKELFKKLHVNAPNGMFTASADKIEEKRRAAGIRQELFDCMLEAVEAVDMFKRAHSKPETTKRDLVYKLNKRATRLAMRLNNLTTAIVKQDDPRDVEPPSGDTSDLITP